jgi:hypothetical protein
MSRSRKKVSIAKPDNDQYAKGLCHARNRMLERESIYLSSRQYKYTVNPWDIFDWKMYIPKDSRFFDYEKYLRK